MSVINCRCGKPIKSGMEVEHSAWLNEFFCSPDCAQDRYFEYMESTPVDFENKLPDGASINADGFLVDDTEQCVQSDEIPAWLCDCGYKHLKPYAGLVCSCGAVFRR